jgi:hypothetical protein
MPDDDEPEEPADERDSPNLPIFPAWNRTTILGSTGCCQLT